MPFLGLSIRQAHLIVSFLKPPHPNTSNEDSTNDLPFEDITLQ